MRLFYCDPGLSSDLGHHAQSCRALVGEARRRGIETRVIASASLDAKLQAELGARPHFRVSPYSRTDGDPICGWLSGFHTGVNQTVEDFRKLNGEMNAGDVLYLNSGHAAQFLALIFWITSSPLPTRAAIEFGVDPGVELTRTPNGLAVEARDPRVEAGGVLFRFAGRHFDPRFRERLRLATFDPASSAAYELLLESPVAALPVPRGRVIAPRPRIPGAPLTVALLGHQRGDKGYRLVPEIAAALLRRFPGEELRLLVHNAQPAFMPAEQDAMRRLAAGDRRCVIDERTADAACWAELLAAADLILCPYDPRRFATSYSALASEAVANGIPLVVPAGTSLSRVASEFGAGTAFTEWQPGPIADAVAAALLDFDALKARAEAGAGRWAQHHGPAHCLTALLRLLDVAA